MKVLVTGGAGFIGSHVVDRLQAAGHEPRIFDLVPSPHHGDEVETVLGDLCDRDAALARARGLRRRHPPRGGRRRRPGRRPIRRTPTASTRAARRSCSRRRASSSSAASSTPARSGSTATPRRPRRSTRTRRSPLPKHFYTATKIAGEMYSAAYTELYGLEHTILRFGIPYGPRARPTAVVAAFAAKALAGQPLTIAGDGTQSRRFVYVEDLAEGVVAALVPAAANRVYNLVGRENTSVRSIARTVRDVVGDVPIVHVEGRAGDLKGGHISGDARRARARLGADDDVRRGRRALRRLGDGRGRDAERRDRRRARTAAPPPSCARSRPSCSGRSRAAARRRPARGRASRAARSTRRSRAAPSRGPRSTTAAAASRGRARAEARPR